MENEQRCVCELELKGKSTEIHQSNFLAWGSWQQKLSKEKKGDPSDEQTDGKQLTAH